ncbi:MAG TPA: hypothetical protein ENJ01_01660 [Gammaproteobacteria bacterium]|nr:hypothetical protein [Gammaproteobacteria bacterium]
MDWMKIGSVILIGMMIVFLLPRARQMVKHSPKAGEGDWKAFLLPIGAVVLFVILLIMSVR